MLSPWIHEKGNDESNFGISTFMKVIYYTLSMKFRENAFKRSTHLWWFWCRKFVKYIRPIGGRILIWSIHFPPLSDLLSSVADNSLLYTWPDIMLAGYFKKDRTTRSNNDMAIGTDAPYKTHSSHMIRVNQVLENPEKYCPNGKSWKIMEIGQKLKSPRNWKKISWKCHEIWFWSFFGNLAWYSCSTTDLQGGNAINGSHHDQLNDRIRKLSLAIN